VGVNAFMDEIDIIFFISKNTASPAKSAFGIVLTALLLHPRGKERMLNGKNLQPFPNIIVDFA
jgi:hypothetical protein